jgi:hypothetical protein
LSNNAALTPRIDANKNQVKLTRLVLQEMMDIAEQAIDRQVAQSTPMTPKK